MCPWKKKCRYIEREFDKFIFKPKAIPLSRLPVVNLGHDEMEAIRFVDVEHMRQEDAAKKMGISSGTIQRIIESAREKIGRALINGYAVVIDGGLYKVKK